MRYSDFTNLYSLQKTLRFELIAQGKTLEKINDKGLLKQDEKRADDYQNVKKIIDRYHKQFMEQTLTDLKLAVNNLKDFEKFYATSEREKSDDERKKFDSLKVKLRKSISEKFQKSDSWKDLFGAKLIKEQLAPLAENDEERQLIAEFKNFSTYFTGFHENRKNMYSADEQATAIAYRLVHENLPKFLDNKRIFEKRIRDNKELKHSFTALQDNFLGKRKIAEVFCLEFFNSTLTQTGIDLYNEVLGGLSKEDGTKLQGLNEHINLYNQKQEDKSQKIPKLKPLFKQILSDRESASFQLEAFTNDTELLESIEKFYQSIHAEHKTAGGKVAVLRDLKTLVQEVVDGDVEKIFLRNDTSLTDIAQTAFGSWGMIKAAMDYYYETQVESKPVKVTKQYETDKQRWLKRSHYSIREIENALVNYKDQTDAMKAFKLTGNSQPICNYFKNFKSNEDQQDLLTKIEAAYKAVKNRLNTEYPNDKKLAQNKAEVAQIKTLLDAIKEFQQFVKPLNPEKLGGEKDERFYGAYVPLYQHLNEITHLYNKTRNYLTQKPYSLEKFKLNFENSTLAAGWDKNKERDNTCVLLRKNNLYYLAVMDKASNNVFTDENIAKEKGSGYEKMVYKLLPGANKMLPKVFLSKKGREIYKPSKDLLAKYAKETHKKGDNFNLKDCRNLIDFFKQSIAAHEDWKHFGFKFSETKTYNDLSDFYKEVEPQGYKVTWQAVSETYIHQLVDEGKLYLFQIYNKDFSEYSKGRPNLHTIYWRMLFDAQNLKDVVYKLNGEAELFYRKKSIAYDTKILKEGHHAAELKGKFAYPIISNRRFTNDKFQFHVPITMNFKATGMNRIDFDVREFLKDNPDINIIGIDRGERHLLYLTLIDQKRKIIKQMTLNEIVNSYHKNGKTVEVKTDYHEKLDKKEADREKARKDWGTIERIKDLKEGYLSHVIHVIAQMMVEHNAIVVMEDLNFGFKRGRQKVEKSVYQNFEKMLIDKLNYLVFKDRKPTVAGGTLKAYQLASKFESFQKLGKQSGFIFYVPAALTSKIDPATGFVDFLKPRYESVAKAKDFVAKFRSISYNKAKDWFEFSLDYKNFIASFENGKSEWTVCSTNVERYRWNSKLNQNKGAQEAVHVTAELKALFKSQDIAFESGQDLRAEIVKQDDAEFFKKWTRLLSTLLSLRHNNGKKDGEERDFILSPVAPFFNSLEAKVSQPQDADANGAYHIALKGLWALGQMNKAKDDAELKKVKLAISNKDWLAFAQSK